jgi:hypothetical protein
MYYGISVLSMLKGSVKGLCEPWYSDSQTFPVQLAHVARHQGFLGTGSERAVLFVADPSAWLKENVTGNIFTCSPVPATKACTTWSRRLRVSDINV